MFFDFEDDATSYLTRMRDAEDRPGRLQLAKHTSYYSMASQFETTEAVCLAGAVTLLT